MSKKFETLYNQVLQEADQFPPENMGAPATAVQPQVPSEKEVQHAKKEEPQPDVTSEGKKFLVELAVRALSVDTANLPASEKDIFNTPVTTKNADEILKRVQSIIDLYS